MNRDNTGQVVWKVIFSGYIFLICKTKTTLINLKKKKKSQKSPDFLPFHQALTQRQSHGRLTGYKVTFRRAEESLHHTINFSPETSTAPFNLSHMATLSTDKIEVTVIAENEDGESLPSRVLIPLPWTGTF